jgi:hypothetical protein
LSLRAQQSNLDDFMLESWDCFVAIAPRNDNFHPLQTAQWVKKIIILFFLLPSIALAQQNNISVDSQVDKSAIHIGDVVKYSVTVTHVPGVKVQMPGKAANLGAFEIRDYKDYDPEKINNQIVLRTDYFISTFDVGEFEIPPLTFRYTVAGDTTEHELKTETLKIVVESMKPSEAGDIRDIKAPLTLPRDWRKLILWGSIALGILLAIAAAVYVWWRKKTGKSLLPQKIEPPRPPHEVALEELTALKNSSLLAEGKIKQYYIRVSEIIRRYIEGRYFIIAMELTTFELVERLRGAEADSEIIDLVHNFLAPCDLVKFAKYRPTADENADIIEKAFAIVERTKLVYDTTPAVEGVSKTEPTQSEKLEIEEIAEAK